MIDRLGFVGQSLGLALAVTAVGALVWRVSGRRPDLAPLSLVFLTLFFLGLTQLPLPDAATMTCPQPHTEPRLMPFRVLRRLAAILSNPARYRSELLAFGALAALMNLLLCAAIGAALQASFKVSLCFAAALGFALSLLVETTQLTAMWGLFPCPWRQFDLDDLLLNLAGVMLGALVMRRLERGRR